ncbi:MAG: radical SAM protein, partial [Elusimicrobiota bacterium]
MTQAKTEEAADNQLQTGPDYIRVMCVFATNQCNLACTHCCAPTVKVAKKAVHLKWEDFKNAIDIFMDPKQTPYPGQKVISIQGGETFLVYPLLEKAVQYAERFTNKPIFSIHTNGTLIKPEQIRKFQEHGAEVLISLDGHKGDNDRFRCFPAGSSHSVWETVMGKIKDLPKDGLGVNMTLRPPTLAGTIDALEAFSEIGIKLVNLEPDCYHHWTKEELGKLAAFFQQLADYYVRRTEAEGQCPFHIGTLHDGLERSEYLKQGKRWWLDCTQLILGADGNFYNCEASNFYDYDTPADFNWEAAAKHHSISHASAGRGVNWAKRQEYMDEADQALGSLSP